jgi:hypothetical protein
MESIYSYDHPKYGKSHIQITEQDDGQLYLQLLSDNKFGHRVQKLFCHIEDLEQLKVAIQKHFEKKYPFK